ncbi:MAG: PAS domain-containing protein [Synergistaceae bacterium]|nr:PAS domain-containing protein [Synergistaceae bacterium]
MFLMLSALFHNRAAEVYVPEAVWGMTFAAYMCLCSLWLFFTMRGEDKYNQGISILTQGLLLPVMAMRFGVIFMSWIGLVFFLAGLIMVFFYATRRGMSPQPLRRNAETSEAGSYKRVDDLLEKLALPACYTDNNGTITWATSSFCAAVGREPDGVTGRIISDLLPMDSEEAILESGRWLLTQEKEGARHYFSLRPIQDGKPPLAPAADISPEDRPIYDKATGLYTDDYRKIRGPEEVSRAQRYKRPLSGLLIGLTFEPGNDVKLSNDQKIMLDNAFKSRVQAVLRTTDCGFLTSDGRIQVLLPETPQTGAKTLLSRIIVLPQDLFETNIRTAINPRVKSGLFFYNGASRMEYGIFSAALEESYVKSKESGGESLSTQAA